MFSRFWPLKGWGFSENPLKKKIREKIFFKDNIESSFKNL